MSLTQRIALTKLQLWERVRPTLKSGALAVPAHPGTAQLIYREPDWKADVIGRILSARDGVFVDVGVNIGQTLIDYTEAPRKSGYVGFEPNSRCVEIANDIIKANRLADAVIIPTGLSDESTVVPFFIHSGDASDSTASLLQEIQPEVAATTVFVPVYPFDMLHRTVLSSRKIALIKIDVEGGELHVLSGMRATLADAKPWILCEVLHRDMHAKAEDHATRCRALMALITEAGYRVHRLLKSGDDKRTIGIEPVSAFPEVVYGPSNKHQCDYMFTPVQDDLGIIGQPGHG